MRQTSLWAASCDAYNGDMSPCARHPPIFDRMRCSILCCVHALCVSLATQTQPAASPVSQPDPLSLLAKASLLLHNQTPSLASLGPLCDLRPQRIPLCNVTLPTLDSTWTLGHGRVTSTTFERRAASAMCATWASRSSWQGATTTRGRTRSRSSTSWRSGALIQGWGGGSRSGLQLS